MTKIYVGEQAVILYVNYTVEQVVSKMRSANNSGSCVLDAYKEEAMTNKVFVNINQILYIEAV